MAVCVTITVIPEEECSPEGITRCNPDNPCQRDICSGGVWILDHAMGCCPECTAGEPPICDENGNLLECVDGFWEITEYNSPQCLVNPPVAMFTSSIDGLTVYFTDTSTNNPTAWLWDFGDGTTSTSRNPTHTYAKAGSYIVTFTCSNSAGASQLPATQTLDVGMEPKPPSPVGILFALGGVVTLFGMMLSGK